jgi:hypothetical protein
LEKWLLWPMTPTSLLTCTFQAQTCWMGGQSQELGIAVPVQG